MKEVNAGQRKDIQVEPESIKDGINRIEVAINPTIERVQYENKEVLSPQNQVSILVAEDDVIYFFFIETVLISMNYKIIHANDGQEAVNIYRANDDIKIILMDLEMPVMDGYAATKEIRKTDTEVPIIAQTSFGFNGGKKKAIFSGCNDFISKPINSKVLIMKIENYLKLPAKN